MQIQPNPQKEFLYLGIFAKNHFYKEEDQNHNMMQKEMDFIGMTIFDQRQKHLLFLNSILKKQFII